MTIVGHILDFRKIGPSGIFNWRELHEVLLNARACYFSINNKWEQEGCQRTGTEKRGPGNGENSRSWSTEQSRKYLAIQCG